MAGAGLWLVGLRERMRMVRRTPGELLFVIVWKVRGRALPERGYCPPRPARFLAGTSRTYRCPGLGVGGRGSLITTVRCCPVSPPRGPTME